MAQLADSAFVEPDQGLSPSPLLSVSFQKDEQRKFKFLEGEPKALGITQMLLSIFHISCISALFGADVISTGLEIPSIISSLLITIAGCLAIASKNLHLPLLKACLGMEVIAGIASIFNLIATLIKMSEIWRFSYQCYHQYDYQEPKDKSPCSNIEAAHSHLCTELVVLQVALFAISITLTVYAAKVVNCCAPAPKVPVITVQAAPR